MDYRIYEEYLKKTRKNKEERDRRCKNMVMTLEKYKTLEKLRDKTPEELLREAGITGVSVDLEKLLNYWDVSAMPVKFSDFEEYQTYKELGGEKEILGAIVVDTDGSLCIFYNETDTPNRQRFTVAHELAHACIDYENLMKNGINFRYEDDTLCNNEIAMNTFAGELLIPTNALKAIFKRFPHVAVDNLPDDILKDLADIFAVSINVMRERLKVFKYQHN